MAYLVADEIETYIATKVQSKNLLFLENSP